MLFSLTFSCENGKEKKKQLHPIFNIEVYDAIPSSHKVRMVFQDISTDTIYAYAGRIERRGGYSISFPKHSFEVDFDKDIPLAGLPADDDWILNANYIDKTFLRHVFSYELFRAMHPNNRAPLTSYIELRFNGSYQGLYVLMEKLDKSSLELQRKDPEAVIFKEPPLFRPDLSTFRPQYADNYYQQTFPNKDEIDKTTFVEKLRELLVNPPDSNFWSSVQEAFDVPNIIDWHLLLLLSNNSDGILKNFYLYKVDTDTPVRIAPWDYDHSFGRDGDNELNMDRLLNPSISLLFERLLAEPAYRQAIKLRWQELNATNILSVSALKNRWQAIILRFERLLPDNFNRWPLNGPHYYDDNDFEQEVAIMEQFVKMRHIQLEAYFTALTEEVIE